MNKKQKSIMTAICIYTFVWLMYHITMVTKAYIGMAYPEVSETMLANLVTLPSLTCIIFSFAIGPIALNRSKTKLAISALFTVFLYCVIFYFNGKYHGPFWLYIVACCLAGYGQGCYVPLLNGIINDHFPLEQIGDRIANYNVAINIGAVILLQCGGMIAAKNGGVNWFNAYLLGIFVLLSIVIFYFSAKKNEFDKPSMNFYVNGEKITMHDLPKNVIFWVVVMGLVHCLFYVTQYVFNINVSSYIITEYKLGTATQAGTATSLVRFSLVVFTLMYPLLRKLFKDWMIPAGYLCVGIGLIVMMFSKSLIGAYACAIIIGIATSLAHSTLYAKAAEFVPSHMVGVAMSIAWGIANIGSSLSAYILEFTASFLGGTMMAQFIVGIIFSIFASALAILLYVKKICKKGVKINE